MSLATAGHVTSESGKTWVSGTSGYSIDNKAYEAMVRKFGHFMPDHELI
jgi:hypothetical protein